MDIVPDARGLSKVGARYFFETLRKLTEQLIARSGHLHGFIVYIHTQSWDLRSVFHFHSSRRLKICHLHLRLGGLNSIIKFVFVDALRVHSLHGFAGLEIHSLLGRLTSRWSLIFIIEIEVDLLRLVKRLLFILLCLDLSLKIAAWN